MPLRLRDPDPIERGRKRAAADTEWNALLSPAKRRPGRWHEVTPAYDSAPAARNAAYEINSGRLQSIPPGRWLACSRGRDGEGVLFVKYLGP